MYRSLARRAQAPASPCAAAFLAISNKVGEIPPLEWRLLNARKTKNKFTIDLLFHRHSRTDATLMCHTPRRSAEHARLFSVQAHLQLNVRKHCLVLVRTRVHHAFLLASTSPHTLTSTSPCRNWKLKQHRSNGKN